MALSQGQLNTLQRRFRNNAPAQLRLDEIREGERDGNATTADRKPKEPGWLTSEHDISPLDRQSPNYASQLQSVGALGEGANRATAEALNYRQQAALLQQQASAGARGERAGELDKYIQSLQPAKPNVDLKTKLSVKDYVSLGYTEAQANVAYKNQAKEDGGVPSAGSFSGKKPTAGGFLNPTSGKVGGSKKLHMGDVSRSARKASETIYKLFGTPYEIGGRRNDPGSDHHTGNAIDVMTGPYGDSARQSSRRKRGDSIASYFMANARKNNIKYIIWRQHIWYPPYRGRGNQWKKMGNRGDNTQNHYDHVHISFMS